MQLAVSGEVTGEMSVRLECQYSPTGSGEEETNLYLSTLPPGKAVLQYIAIPLVRVPVDRPLVQQPKLFVLAPHFGNVSTNGNADLRTSADGALQLTTSICYTEQMNRGEKWVPVVGYEGWYEVSDHGRVRNVKARNRTQINRVMVGSLMRNGYVRVCLRGANRKQIGFHVHRLVALAFLGKPKHGQMVNHINGIKTDNRLENLEWATGSENVRHSLRLGLRPNQERGSGHHAAVLTEADVRQIKALRGVMRGDHIAARFGVSKATVSMIHTGKTWTHVGSDH